MKRPGRPQIRQRGSAGGGFLRVPGPHENDAGEMIETEP